MQITRASEYGMLGLVYLARHGGDRMVMMDEIARDEEIPKSFLAKIFQSLVKAGLVRSFRGAGGGLALARKPGEITVLDVIEAIEGKIALQRCLQEVPACEHMAGCALCGLFERAQDQVKDVFASTTLADLLKPEAAAAGNRRAAALRLPVPRRTNFGALKTGKLTTKT